MVDDRRVISRPGRAGDGLASCWDAALIMGVFYTTIYAATMMAILLVDIPDKNAQTVNILAGAMTIIQTTVVQYFFGSSKNAEDSARIIAASKEKTDEVLRTAVTTVVAPNGHSEEHKK